MVSLLEVENKLFLLSNYIPHSTVILLFQNVLFGHLPRGYFLDSLRQLHQEK